jgi:ArsR family transcriptional regulator, virulence genes transcriptional regulator
MAADGSLAATRNERRRVLAQVEEHAADAAALLKALGNEQRLLVLCALLDGPHSVGEINARVPLSQSALSQHLAVLRAARIVKTRRESQTIWYELEPGPANHIMQALYAAFCAPRARGRRRSVKLQSRETMQCD